MAYEKGRVKAKLIIRGFECSPDEITNILGISPQKTWLCGEAVSLRAKNRHELNGWLLESPLSENNSCVEDQVDSITATIEPHIDSFEKLPKNIKIEVYCTLDAPDYRSLVVQISHKSIQILASINAFLSLDLM